MDGEAYPSCVDSIVDSPKLFNSCIDHVLHTNGVRYIDYDNQRFKLWVGSIALRFLSNLRGRFCVAIGEDYGTSPSFSEGECCLLPDAAAGL
jgi:hypothetical protein